jgi:putative endonuclease
VDKKWYVYILLCRGQTLYCGISDDVLRRLEQHRSGKGAKYTRGRGPLELVYVEECDSYSTALKREYAIKRLPRGEKSKLIETYKTAAE